MEPDEGSPPPSNRYRAHGDLGPSTGFLWLTSNSSSTPAATSRPDFSGVRRPFPRLRGNSSAIRDSFGDKITDPLEHSSHALVGQECRP